MNAPKDMAQVFAELPKSLQSNIVNQWIARYIMSAVEASAVHTSTANGILERKKCIEKLDTLRAHPLFNAFDLDHKDRNISLFCDARDLLSNEIAE